MILIYTDESGINYEIQNNFFKDGPFIIWGGMCVDDSKYYHLERIFIQLIDSYFKIGDWLKQEIHACDIWNRQNFFSQCTESEIKGFFEEVVQVVCKLHTCCIFGIRLKSRDADKDKKRLEIAKAVYAFLHGLEYFLSQEKETGLIIADIIDYCDKVEGDESRKRKILDELLYERMMWRINPKADIKSLIPSKYRFEAQLCFLLDDVHYMHSKHSIFLQIFDVVIYIMMRVFTYLYLTVNPIIEADIKKVPITIDTFQHFVGRNTSFNIFEDSASDVVLISGKDLLYHCDRSNFLNLDMFKSAILSKEQ